jgi:nitroreductase
MNVLDAVKNRRSIRRYDSRPVEDEKLNKVLDSARLAPSANNKQDWKFVVVRDEETRNKLAEAAGGQMFVAQAPVVIVACGLEPEGIMRCGQPRHTVDLSIAVSFIMLEACEQGIGTCWLGHFDEKRVKDILSIPEKVRVVAVTPLGYPAEDPQPRPRKRIDKIICYDKYS